MSLFYSSMSLATPGNHWQGKQSRASSFPHCFMLVSQRPKKFVTFTVLEVKSRACALEKHYHRSTPPQSFSQRFSHLKYCLHMKPHFVFRYVAYHLGIRGSVYRLCSSNRDSTCVAVVHWTHMWTWTLHFPGPSKCPKRLQQGAALSQGMHDSN